jgi:light-regulated signal transduction histidine kinase (bacteriophytochrome)
MELEKRVKERTAQLHAVNQELEAFSYSVSHDLKAPLRAIDNFSALLLEDRENKLSVNGQHIFERIKNNITRMHELIDDLLTLSKITRSELHTEKTDLSVLAENILKNFKKNFSDRSISWYVEHSLIVNADKQLIQIVLENLISNAWKFTAKISDAKIEIGKIEKENQIIFFVRDNGAGFDAQYADDLFRPFKRLHNERDFPGTGIGLATVQRIIQLHGGKIWAESTVGHGATFYFLVT